MRDRHRRMPLGWGLAGAVLAASGCNTFGPASIATGRGVYNEVINRTEDEEILNMIVRERYEDTYSLLEVASVTANIRASAYVGANVGVGSSRNYQGNLVPLSGGFAFEDNPTISYIPLGGEAFMQRLLTPLTIDEVLLINLAVKRRREILFGIFVRSVNGIENPDINPDEADTQGFREVAELWRELRASRSVGVGRVDGAAVVVLRPTDSDEEARCRRFLSLLGIGGRPEVGAPHIVPLQLATGTAVAGAMHIETASVLDVIRAAGHPMEVPPEHFEAGVVEPVDFSKDSDPFIRVRASSTRPDDAALAIRYRDAWYYIADWDLDSKRAFLLLRTLIGMRLHDEERAGAKPVLTIPVG